MENRLVVVVVVAVGTVSVRMPVAGTMIVGMIVVGNSEIDIVVVVGFVAGNAIVVGIDCSFRFVDNFAEQLGNYCRLCSIGIWLAGCWF